MRTVNIHAAKTHLSSLLEEVQKGEEVVIAKAGKPIARIVPIDVTAGKRKLGVLRGKMWAAPDAWDPDPELEQLFNEGDPNFRSAFDDYIDELATRTTKEDPKD